MIQIDCRRYLFLEVPALFFSANSSLSAGAVSSSRRVFIIAAGSEDAGGSGTKSEDVEAEVDERMQEIMYVPYEIKIIK